MAIIQCPHCNYRVSSMAKHCEKCQQSIKPLTEQERERLQSRRKRTLIYRARNVTYLAMTLIVVGVVVWWLSPPNGLALPMPNLSGGLFAVGTVVYVSGWSWLLMLKIRRTG